MAGAAPPDDSGEEKELSEDMDEQRTQQIPTATTDTVDMGPVPDATMPRTPAIPAAVPPAQVPPEAGNGGAPHCKRWPIVVASVAAVALIAAGAGLLVYRHAQQTALADCRAAVSDFSKARKDLLATTENAPQGEQLVRQILGVDKLLDAFADAMDAAEGTVNDEACASNALPIQLNIVADTVRSATDSLNKSADKINAEIKSETKKGVQDWLAGITGGSDGADADADADKDATAGDQALSDARQGLEDSLDAARSLASQLTGSIVDGTAGRLIKDGLNTAIDAAQKLVDDSGVTDTKAFKAAKVTLDESVQAVRDWIDSQAAKAQ